MGVYEFEKLNLKENELILIETVGSQQFVGAYLGEYNNSDTTFKFGNHSNGQTETIFIEKLQQLRRLK
jgi:hypothetical protein